MKGERLFVKRQVELLEHLTEEKDSTIKFKFGFPKMFLGIRSRFRRSMSRLWDSGIHRLLVAAYLE